MYAAPALHARQNLNTYTGVFEMHFSINFAYCVSYVLQVQLQRERLELSPVFSTAMQHGDHATGYIRLVNFSQKAAPEMRHAITELQVNNEPV